MAEVDFNVTVYKEMSNFADQNCIDIVCSRHQSEAIRHVSAAPNGIQDVSILE